MTAQKNARTVCPACGAEGTGRFCANCGATLTSGTCAGCGAKLSPGAHFCHRCGKPVGAAASIGDHTLSPLPPKTGLASSLPWAVAAIALLALLAMSAGRFFNSSRGDNPAAPQNGLPQAGVDDRGMPSGTTDISKLSPEESADRLFNRVMLLNSEGKSDSVLFFAPMAINAYQILPQMNNDQRYDLGRIAEVSGALPLAKAQADTILRADPNHLLGLILTARVASLSGDSAAQKRYQAKFLAAEKAELARNLPEYERHQNDITAADSEGRRSAVRKK